MSATETLDALMTAIKPLEAGQEHWIHPENAKSLCGLEIGDLIDRGFGRPEAGST